jgi:hypothetical protein
MNNADIYFRMLDGLSSKENFLEKEMLDSDIHHLEVRTTFFDRLAVLGAGTLAIAIPFMASGFQSDVLRHAMQAHLCTLRISVLFVLCSLLLCLVHNFLVSVAVTYLSKQLEFLYHATNVLRVFRQKNPGLVQIPDDILAEVTAQENKAKMVGETKEKVIPWCTTIGISAVVCLMIGYFIGLSSIFSIFDGVK